MMTQAAQTGQNFSNELNAKLGAAGFAGGEASSPIGAFTQAAGGEAAGNLQRSARQQLFSQALESATQNVNNRAGIWAGSQAIQQQQPTFGQNLGGAILGAVGAAAPYMGSGGDKVPTVKVSPNANQNTIAGDDGYGGFDSSRMYGTNSAGAFGGAGTMAASATPKKKKGLFGFLR
jgi:hypothetical protein